MIVNLDVIYAIHIKWKTSRQFGEGARAQNVGEQFMFFMDGNSPNCFGMD
jgi:hypothetical protein